MADAPLFIDADQISRFHDAVVRPEYEIGPTTLEVTDENSSKIAGKIGADLTIKPNALLHTLSSLVPFVKAELKVSGEVSGERGKSHSESRTVEVRPIVNAQRQLEQLVLHYLVNHQDRLFPPKPTDEEWKDPRVAATAPRAIVFLDLPPGTKLIPTAAEFGGKVELIYQKLRSRDGKTEPPDYPDRGEAVKLAEGRKAYWAWFEEHFSATKAMVAVEEAAGGKDGIRWIDYRLPIGGDGHTIHLHVAPAGRYDIGTFAYYFIKRGFKHGLRIVGTLKSEPELNVLAVYEK